MKTLQKLAWAFLSTLLLITGCSVVQINKTGETLTATRISVLQDTEIGKIEYGTFHLEGGKTTARLELLKALAELK